MVTENRRKKMKTRGIKTEKNAVKKGSVWNTHAKKGKYSNLQLDLQKLLQNTHTNRRENDREN